MDPSLVKEPLAHPLQRPSFNHPRGIVNCTKAIFDTLLEHVRVWTSQLQAYRKMDAECQETFLLAQSEHYHTGVLKTLSYMCDLSVLFKSARPAQYDILVHQM